MTLTTAKQPASKSTRTQTTGAVSVIICAYTEKRWSDLLACVEGLQAQTIQPQDIIISIDHNPALYQRAVDAIDADNVQIVENHNPRGLSGARNTAIALADQPILAFIDEDAVPHPDWLAQLLAHYEDDNVLGVGGTILPNWLSGRPAWFPEEFNWVVGCSYKGLPEDVREVRNLIGCNMSYRREVFEAIGVFRDGIGRIGTLPVGCEETELCIRALQHFPNGRFLHNPAAKVSHNVPAERVTLAYFRSRCYSEGLSKALISTFIGQKDALSTETSYVTRTLPAGVLRNLRDMLRGDVAGAGRALSIVAGLGITGIGFLRGKLKYALAPADESDSGS